MNDGPTPGESAVALVAVGRIGAPRGVRGEVFVEPRTDDPDGRFAVGARLLTEPDDAGPLEVATASRAGGKLVVRFDGVDTREAAEPLRGVLLLVAAADRPALVDPDDYYDTDLVGLRVRTAAGVDLGPVTAIRHAGAATHLVVRPDGRDQLIPFVAAIVPSVDVPGGSIVVNPPEGLLEL